MDDSTKINFMLVARFNNDVTTKPVAEKVKKNLEAKFILASVNHNHWDSKRETVNFISTGFLSTSMILSTLEFHYHNYKQKKNGFFSLNWDKSQLSRKMWHH